MARAATVCVGVMAGGVTVGVVVAGGSAAGGSVGVGCTVAGTAVRVDDGSLWQAARQNSAARMPSKKSLHAAPDWHPVAVGHCAALSRTLS